VLLKACRRTADEVDGGMVLGLTYHNTTCATTAC